MAALPWPLIVVCAWVVLAAILQAIPTKRKHWPAAYGLMMLLVPVVLFCIAQSAWTALLFALVAASFILRWPLWYGWLWVKRRLGT